MRVACLLVPDLPLQAALRADPELEGQPLVITSGPGNRAEIVSLAREAASQGVRVGQTLPQARAVCPGIEVRVASPALERSTREALLDVALSLAPRAELAPRRAGIFASEGVAFVDASGTRALHGTESAFASVLHARAERAGLVGFVALAASRGVARLAARHLALAAVLAASSDRNGEREPRSRDAYATTRVLSPDQEIAFLSPLPIDLLDPDDRTAEALTRFGVRRIRDLLRLPPRDLAARLGPGLLSLVARARGEEEEPPIPEPRTTLLEEGLDLEHPVDRLEPLTFVLRGLVSRLTERLALRGLGAVELRLDLQLENGARQSRRIGVASPCHDDRVLLRLLRLALEKAPPIAPIESLTVLCEGIALRREQLDLFLPRGPSPSDLDQTLAELASLCGEDRVGAPEIADTHRPDAFAIKPFKRPRPQAERMRTQVERPRHPTTAPPRAHPGASPPRRRDARRSPPPNRSPAHATPAAMESGAVTGARPRALATRGPRWTMRALRPPVRAEVHLVEGRPAHLRCSIGEGEIRHAAGPWRTTGHWWSESAHFAVDHYDIELQSGAVLRLCFDWKTKRWQIDGLYD